MSTTHKRAGGWACVIDTPNCCTLPMAAARLRLSVTEAEALLKKHGAPWRPYFFPKDREEWTEEEAEQYQYAVDVLGVTECDWPTVDVPYYSGKAVRELCLLLADKARTTEFRAETEATP